MSDLKLSVMDDDREIDSLLIDGKGWQGVGSDGITKIVCYGERGEMSLVPWFAIYKGDGIVSRVNGKMAIEVNYR